MKETNVLEGEDAVQEGKDEVDKGWKKDKGKENRTYTQTRGARQKQVGRNETEDEQGEVKNERRRQ